MDDKNELTLEHRVKLLTEAIENDRKERAAERHRRSSSTRLCVICATIAFIAVLCIGGLFLALASGMTITTETTESTITQDTGEGGGNNVYQSGESAQYHESGE